VVKVKIRVRVSGISRVSKVRCKVSADLRISEKPGTAGPNQFENDN